MLPQQALTQSERYTDTLRQYGIGSGFSSAVDSGAHLLAGGVVAERSGNNNV